MEISLNTLVGLGALDLSRVGGDDFETKQSMFILFRLLLGSDPENGYPGPGVAALLIGSELSRSVTVNKILAL